MNIVSPPTPNYVQTAYNNSQMYGPGNSPFNNNVSGNYGPALYQFNPNYLEQYNKGTDEQRLTALKKFYKEISDRLTTKNVGFDPLKLTELLDKSRIDNTDLTKFYRHLLNYTYASTALEVKNHEEVNLQLQEIRNLLLILVPQSKQNAALPGPPTVPQ